MKTQIVQGFAPTAALRHCEARSNPDMMRLFLDCFVVPPRNDAKRVKKVAFFQVLQVM